MRRRSLLVAGIVAALVATALPAFAGSSRHDSPAVPNATVRWTIGTDFTVGGTRFDGAFVQSTGLVYFLGFRTFADQTDGSVWTYNPTTRVYADTGVDMPVPISNYSIAALQDSRGLGLYVFGGRSSTGEILTTVQVYYPAQNRAQVISTDPWPGTTPSGCVSLPAMGVAVVQNKAVVMGGASFSTSVPPCIDDNSSQTWIFDPAAASGAKWSAGPPLNVARGYVTAAVLQGRIYAIGGDQNAAGVLNAISTVEAWKPFGGSWNDAAITDLPIGCDETQAFPQTSGPLRGITVAGCGQWPNAVPDTYLYDTTTNAWSFVGSLQEPVRNHAGVQLAGGLMYVVGGYDCPGNACLGDPTVLSENGKGQAIGGPGSPSRVGLGAATGSTATN
jgi:Kelch motif protein